MSSSTRCSSLAANRNGSSLPLALLAAALFAAFAPQRLHADDAPAAGWKAGAAKAIITPEQPLWMSGYGGRDRPAEGKLTELWAKALVLEDKAGQRAVVVTLDLVGIDRETSLAARNEIARRLKTPLASVALCTSHTHCGPVVGRNLGAMYFLDESMWSKIDAYTEKLIGQIADVAEQAAAGLAPSRVEYGNGKATFAVNRRENVEANVPELRERGELRGPVDHDVPVLTVRDREGTLKAVLFGYACHATVMGFYQWSGDYPGFAMQNLEEAHPGAVALFWAGCGADQNPLPRRTVELCQNYGKQLSDAVDAALAAGLKPLPDGLKTSYREIDLAFDELPTKDQLSSAAEGKDRYQARRAQILLDRIARDGGLSPTYPYPVQVWRLGNEISWVILGGEVVVDFALRLKNQIAGPTWVAGYSNDVMAYIPSLRVLREGRYEGASSMVYYGQPTTWSPRVEEHIIETVLDLAQAVGAERQE